MSQALRNSIGQRLSGSLALDALVARDPSDPTTGAVFAYKKNQVAPVYPCVTYRLMDEDDDRRFQASVPGGPSSPVTEVILQLEAWSDASNSAQIEAIKAVLDSLFKDKAWDMEDESRVFRSSRLTSKTDLYDDKLKVWFGLFLYRLQIQYPYSIP